MTDEVFGQHIKMIMSMSLDYLRGGITQGTYIANLKIILLAIEKEKTK